MSQILPDGHEEPFSSAADERGRMSFLERLLDPASLQIMMAVSGGLLFLGFVAWLWTIGLFDQPLHVAIGIGAVNLTLIGVGIGLIKKTRFHLAGRAIAMLGCLTLPLNLWFYDAQGLITLDNGGHLWIPAFMCSVIYAAIAAVLVDALFVYAFVGGIALTGLLILGDHQVARFYEIIAPSALLVVWGVICAHVEKAFLKEGSTITQFNFGKAFFRAGHLTMASGLGLLLGGRIAGHFYDAFLAGNVWFTMPTVASDPGAQLTALTLVLAATWTYFFGWFMHPKQVLLAVGGLVTTAWSIVIGCDLIGIELSGHVLLIVMAILATLLQLAAYVWGRQVNPLAENREFADSLRKSASMLASLAGVLGLAEMTRFVFDLAGNKEEHLIPMSLIAMLGANLISTMITAVLLPQTAIRPTRLTVCTLAIELGWSLLLATLWLFDMGISVSLPLVGLAGLVVSVVLEAMKTEEKQKILHSLGYRLAMISAVVLTGLGGLSLCCEITHLRDSFDGLFHLTRNGFWLIGLEVAINFGLLNYMTGQKRFRLLTLLACSAVLAERYHYLTDYDYAPLLAISFVSLVEILITTITRKTTTDVKKVFAVGLPVFVLSATAGILIAVNRVLTMTYQWDQLSILLLQLVMSVLAIVIVTETAWRRGLQVTAVVQLILASCLFVVLSEISFFHGVELVSMFVGLGLLISGHLGWKSEGETKDHSITAQLSLGSLAVSVPWIVGLVLMRAGLWDFDATWTTMHNLVVLLVGLSLLGSGLLCRIRSTTIWGTISLASYLLSLFFLLHLPRQLQSVSVMMMVGGGVFFVIAILLSVYRETLIHLPQRFKEGEGVFEVLKWR